MWDLTLSSSPWQHPSIATWSIDIIVEYFSSWVVLMGKTDIILADLHHWRLRWSHATASLVFWMLRNSSANRAVPKETAYEKTVLVIAEWYARAECWGTFEWTKEGFKDGPAHMDQVEPSTTSDNPLSLADTQLNQVPLLPRAKLNRAPSPSRVPHRLQQITNSWKNSNLLLKQQPHLKVLIFLLSGLLYTASRGSLNCQNPRWPQMVHVRQLELEGSIQANS